MFVLLGWVGGGEGKIPKGKREKKGGDGRREKGFTFFFPRGFSISFAFSVFVSISISITVSVMAMRMTMVTMTVAVWTIMRGVSF